jgi:hypothetical protein
VRGVVEAHTRTPRLEALAVNPGSPKSLQSEAIRKRTFTIARRLPDAAIE